jgi:hypothetical protein
MEHSCTFPSSPWSVFVVVWEYFLLGSYKKKDAKMSPLGLSGRPQAIETNVYPF